MLVFDSYNELTAQNETVLFEQAFKTSFSSSHILGISAGHQIFLSQK